MKSDNVIIFASTIRHNLEDSIEAKPTAFTHIFAYCSLPYFLIFSSFFFISFLFRELSLAILLGQVCWQHILLVLIHLRNFDFYFILEEPLC